MDIQCPSPPGASVRWLDAQRRNTRARLLQRMGITSGALRSIGLRLSLDAAPCDQGLPPGSGTIGIAARILSVDRALQVEEALYTVGEVWHPFWRGVTVIGVRDEQGPASLPEPMALKARTWIGLIRGSIPLASENRRLAGS